MIESIMKKIKSRKDYEKEINETKRSILKISDAIEICEDSKPLKILKKKFTRYENEVNNLYRIKNFLEVRLERLKDEKKKLYP